MQIKPAGLDNLSAIVHCLNAALEHVPPVTRSMIEANVKPHVDALDAVINPREDKNMEHA